MRVHSRSTLVLVGLCAALFVPACSSSSDDGGASTDGGGADAGSDTTTTGDTSGTDSSPTSDATDALADADEAGGCNTIDNAATKFTSTKSTAAMPTPAGGTIVDGTYFETAETAYEASTAGPGGDHQETNVIAAGKLEVVKLGVTNPIDRTSWTFTTSGTTLTLTRTCPSAKTQPLGFTASGNTLMVFDSLAKTVKTYTKQ